MTNLQTQSLSVNKTIPSIEIPSEEACAENTRAENTRQKPTLEHLPNEILGQIAKHLDTVSSAAFGLSSPSIYGAHFTIHGALTNLYTQTPAYSHLGKWNLFQVIYDWSGLREFRMVRRWEMIDEQWGRSGYVTNFVHRGKLGCGKSVDDKTKDTVVGNSW